MIVSPSLLSADFGRLNEEIEMLNASEADWIHVDVMDGVFVPNISFGFPVMSTLKQKSYKPLDVHLMIVDPDRYVKRFKEAGADILNVHYEACTHLHRTIQSIKAEHMKAAVTLNPHTPVSVLEDIIGDLDMVLLMSVNPGYGGQKFIEHTYEKVSRLKELVEKSGSDCLIEIDGGVNAQNAVLLKNAGADAVVAGSSIFGAADPKAVIQEMKSI
ncbi:MAG: ribulose-phosphate 3-epimerase [Paludibacteraceae bacterium]|jgi:ribulose-phosphate 3-epimerase|nr:ribulose-phosphate 3-epimerase [Bacteroidales bacterium]MBP3466542.1 ribulose-phosphate 3-epimerase [Paludibacteraceae bacterium]MBQ2051060.1 ribulose-phosphate 3-epimerase [Paludibacteraceae bacterium]MBQ6962238.1 ribulose-phosphate 3-epimerase [Paludibacteraceae bacterium]MBR0497576.1 ribulose-phosphate 3-epimerase [Paludibacteraceae bacterium]